MLIVGTSGISFAQASAPDTLSGASIRKPADTAAASESAPAAVNSAAAPTASPSLTTAPDAASSAPAPSQTPASTTASIAPAGASAVSVSAPGTSARAKHSGRSKKAPKNSAKDSGKDSAKVLASAKSSSGKDTEGSRANGSDTGGATGPFSSLQFSGSKGPIDIKSDSLDLDYKANVVTFRGHVHASQADALLTSDSLTVTYGKDFHEVKELVANDNVRMSQGTRWATGDRAVLDQARHTMILTGNPVVHDGEDQVAGSKITVHLDTGKSEVEGARAVFFPNQQKTRDNKRATAVAKSP